MRIPPAGQVEREVACAHEHAALSEEQRRAIGSVLACLVKDAGAIGALLVDHQAAVLAQHGADRLDLRAVAMLAADALPVAFEMFRLFRRDGTVVSGPDDRFQMEVSPVSGGLVLATVFRGSAPWGRVRWHASVAAAMTAGILRQRGSDKAAGA